MYFLNDFIKNPQTRNARPFLPLNISAVGSVFWKYIFLNFCFYVLVWQDAFENGKDDLDEGTIIEVWKDWGHPGWKGMLKKVK